jgi:hypothetical protein
MTPDPIAAVLDQLAARSEQLAELDTREAAHVAELRGQVAQLAGVVTTISRTLAEDTAALARLDALDRQVADLARQASGFRESNGGACQAPQAPAWHKLDAAGRRAPVAELRDWVEQVYRPGYGHLAVLGPCWAEHDLCLYGLGILSRLWRFLYLQPEPGASLLSAQAEYQARILPALAAQLAAETARCRHASATTYPGARRD